MGAIVLDTLLQAVTGMLTHAIPGWVSTHPKQALMMLVGYALMEHLWPVLKGRGWVKGNSTLSVLANAIAAAMKNRG